MKITGKIITVVLMCTLIIGLSGTAYAEEQNRYAENEDPGASRYQGDIPEGFFDDPEIQKYSQKVVHDSRFEGYTIKKGIDVSEWNGIINWENVKKAGIEFAIIRGAYRGYGKQGTLVKDKNVDNNFKQAEKAGIPVGAYIFSQATTVAEAIEEARYLLNIVKGYNISLPLVLDFEYASDSSGLTGRLYDADLSPSEATAVCRAFCKTVEDAGYTAMVYANKDMLEYDLNASQISKDYQIWLAHYTNQTSYKGDYNFWQYTSQGSVNGISGNVDINYWYIASKSLIQNNGEWLYYIGGVFQKNYTGLEKIDSKWYYIKNGKWQKNYTGLVKYSSGIQYYVKDGVIQHGFTGLIKLGSSWYYIVSGRWQSEYTGLAEYSSGTQYYVKNGIIQHGYTGVLKIENKWCYISGGKYEPYYTGLAKYISGSFYYMENGSIRFEFTGLKKIENMWYYISGGRWQSDYTGLAEYSSGTQYYVENGMIRHDFTGLIKLSDVWYYIIGGRWQAEFTGLAKYSTGSCYYVNDGVIDYGYRGFVSQGNYTYYVNAGKWQKGFSGIVVIAGMEYTVSDGLLD